jgi:manganese/zinc/iron transport system permease protein
MLGIIDILTTVGSLFVDDWFELDTWIVVTAALAAMGCSIPGSFLVLRRQSMMGDALTHTILPGIVAAFLLSHALKASGWITATPAGTHIAFDATSYAMMFVGAVLTGTLTAVLTEWVSRQGRVETSAALGVVYTSLFAIGLLMIRLAADSVHIDPDCVLYGNIETVWTGSDEVPRATWIGGGALLLNIVLVSFFFKELRISTFDPALATSLGIHSTTIHYVLMAVTAITAVAAFESVGNILVVAMLIVPPATAHLLTDRLWLMLVLAALIAALSAALGHGLALTLPPLLMAPFAEEPLLQGVDVQSLDASTSGMMAVAAGGLFTLALVLGPRHGLLVRLAHRLRLATRIAAEDLLGILYRHEEAAREPQLERPAQPKTAVQRFARWRLRRRRLIDGPASDPSLTETGREAAQQLVRAHRLWESYMARHFDVPGDHLHEAAHRVEHFLDHELRDQLADELESPETDPHGRDIPQP